MCFKDSTHAKLVNYLGAEVTKAEVEQYQGIEVCAVEGVGSLKNACKEKVPMVLFLKPTAIMCA